MIAKLLEFANFLAAEAGVISRKYFRQGFIIESKDNSTPVTIADREIELRLRSLIKEYYPSHGIIGEEFANQDATNEWCWVLDPIDGTVAFTTGKPTFTTLIALVHQQQVVLSVIDQAISQERFSATLEGGAYLNQQPLRSSQVVDLADVRLNATTPYMFKTLAEQNSFELLRRKVRVTAFGGDAYAFALLAAGHIDVILEADLQYYDVAALLPLITASGGVISDWQGQPLTAEFNGQCLASANSALHRQVVALINT